MCVDWAVGCAQTVQKVFVPPRAGASYTEGIETENQRRRVNVKPIAFSELGIPLVDIASCREGDPKHLCSSRNASQVPIGTSKTSISGTAPI